MIGVENNSEKTVWNNTRGIIADGKLGDRFTYYAFFLENQSVFPSYITDKIVQKSVGLFPGRGESRWSPDSTLDYSMHLDTYLTDYQNSLIYSLVLVKILLAMVIDL